MLERTSTTARYARGFAAAVAAVTALVLAANAGPARAAEPSPRHDQVQPAQVQHTPGQAQSR